MSDTFGLWGLIALFGMLGVTKGLIGFNLVHDALHGSFSSNKTVNAIIGYWFDFNGTASFIWKISHNRNHHVYTNIPGHDEDIDKAIILRLNPTDKIYPFHKYQHIYAPFLYSLISFNWVFYSDYVWFFREAVKQKIPAFDLTMFLGLKILNLTVFLFLPLYFLQVPWWTVLLGYASMHIFAGITIAIVFQLAHIVEGVKYFIADPEGNVPKVWAEHEILTTSNFAVDNTFLTGLIGGLNFQIEHHLFPHVSHVHYPAISKILRKTLEEYHLPYLEHPTFYAAVCSHFRALKNLATMVPENQSVSIKGTESHSS